MLMDEPWIGYRKYLVVPGITCHFQSRLSWERSEMNRRLRIILFIFGLLIIMVALWLLVGALLPGETIMDQATLEPTLFVMP